MKSLSTVFASILRPRALLSAAILFAGSASAQAGPVLFNAAGTGPAGATLVATFDELPGNALALGAVPLINAAMALPAGTVTTTTSFTLYAQANVRLLDSNGNQVNIDGNTITAVIKFQETATVTSGNQTVTFNLAANQAGSYFDLFARVGAGGSNSSGVGFANDVAGTTLIYSSAPGTSGSSGNFTNLGGSSNLDQTAGPGSGTGQQTVSGFGGSRLVFNTVYSNAGYFVGGAPSAITFNTNTNLPFTEAAPSSQFVNLTGAGAGSTFAGYVTPSLGTLNGSNGRDIQFQADASSSFVTVVPEPASVAMTAMGLVGLGVFASRRRKATV